MGKANWILTADGSAYHFGSMEMLFNKPSIEVMAHAGSQLNRFTGHTLRPYSVDEHQILCAHLAADYGLPPFVQLACLVHDAHEAYTGDVSSPVKWTIGQYWDNFERPHARFIRAHLNLQSVFAAHRDDIKRMDLIALATERRDLLPWVPGSSEPWALLDTPGAEIAAADHIRLNTTKRRDMWWHEWRDEYLTLYHALRGACGMQKLQAMQDVMKGDA